MAFRFRIEDDSVQGALHRIADGELRAALAHLAVAEGVAATGVHDVRKRIKKLRGLLRLLRPGFPGFEVENAALRAAGQSLSSLRDAEVRLATFDAVFPADCPAPLTRLRACLAADRDTGGAAAEDARRQLATLHARVPTWHLKGRDRHILAAGLARTRRGAQKTMAEAIATRDIEAMHNWRKRAKDHWYQARLLVPVWPGMMQPVIDACEALTEDLGDHHDLAMLESHALALPEGTLSATGRVLLTTHIAAAQATLEARAFPLGQRLFAGDPAAMAALWVGWWRVWRG